MFLKNKGTGGGDENKKSNNDGNQNNGRPGKDKNTNSSNHASCVANRNETPSVPLPTQNFRQ